MIKLFILDKVVYTINKTENTNSINGKHAKDKRLSISFKNDGKGIYNVKD